MEKKIRFHTRVAEWNMPVLGFTLYGALALVREFVAARVEESVSLYLISLMKSRALLQNSLK